MIVQANWSQIKAIIAPSNRGLEGKKPKACLIFSHQDHLNDKQLLLITDDDQVFVCGSNKNGILATGDELPIEGNLKRIDSLSGRKIVKVVAGYDHALALTSSGQVLSWGSNKCGQLGVGTRIQKSLHPCQVSIPDDDPISMIEAGHLSSFALSSNSKSIYVWGGPRDHLFVPIKIGSYQGAIGCFQAIGASLVITTDVGKFPIDWPTPPSGPYRNIALTHVRKHWLNMVVTSKPFGSSKNIGAAICDDGILRVWGAFGIRLRKSEKISRVEEPMDLFATSTAIIVSTREGRIFMLKKGSDPNKPREIDSIDVLEEILVHGESLWYEFSTKGANHFQLEACFEDEENADVRFVFPNESKQIPAHRLILMKCSDKFRFQFNGDWKDSKVITIKEASYKIYRRMIYYLYSGRLASTSLNSLELVELYILAVMNMIEQLVVECISAMRSKLESAELSDLEIAFAASKGHDELRETIASELIKRISFKTCHPIARFAFKQDHKELWEASVRFIIINFEKVALKFANEGDRFAVRFFKTQVQLNIKESVNDLLLEEEEEERGEEKGKEGDLNTADDNQDFEDEEDSDDYDDEDYEYDECEEEDEEEDEENTDEWEIDFGEVSSENEDAAQ